MVQYNVIPCVNEHQICHQKSNFGPQLSVNLKPLKRFLKHIISNQKFPNDHAIRLSKKNDSTYIFLSIYKI